MIVRRLARGDMQEGYCHRTTVIPRQSREPDHGPGALRATLRTGMAVIVFAIMLTPGATWARACDDKLGETVQVTGRYVAAAQRYAQAFVFAMVLDCQGTQEVVTVQRATGDFPVCAPDEMVEVAGKLVWNRAMVDGHYEINNPSHVACVTGAPAESKTAASAASPGPAPAPLAPAPAAPAPAPQASPTTPGPRQAQAKGVASTVWMGRYQDSRGAGELRITLVRGTSTVSGTWTARTGGAGPLVGTLEGDGRRMQFRMENLASECPGTLQGVAELGDTTLIGTYSGQDCEGTVTDGRLDLRVQ